MELKELKGAVIGVISHDYLEDDLKDKTVRDIITKKVNESLKMVKLDESILDKKFCDLSRGEKSKAVLASKLHDKEIVLVNFSRGLLKKDYSYFRSLFKKIVQYGKKVILVEPKMDLFLGCADRIYVILDGEVKYDTLNIFDKVLLLYTDAPSIVAFEQKCEDRGIRLDYYTELDELLKAIYRIKS